MVGAADHGEVREVGGAAVDPVPEMVGVAPGQGPVAVGEDAAAVADGRAERWAGWMTRVLRPTSRG